MDGGMRGHGEQMGRMLRHRKRQDTVTPPVVDVPTTSAAAPTTSAVDPPAATTSAPSVPDTTTAVPETSPPVVTPTTSPVVPDTTTDLVVTTPTVTTTRRQRTSSVLTTSDTELLSTSATSSLTVPAVVTSTSVVSVSQSSTSSSVSLTLSSSATAQSSTGGSSGGPEVGTVVGIVAGVLVGVVFLAAIIGYCFRQKWGRKDEDDDVISPFDKDEFRRASVLLDEDGYAPSARGGGHSPQMSEYSMSNMGHGVAGSYGRGGMGSMDRGHGGYGGFLEPGQVMSHGVPGYPPVSPVNARFGGNGGPAPRANFAGHDGAEPIELIGGYPAFPAAAASQPQTSRAMYAPTPAPAPAATALHRNPSDASSYSVASALPPPRREAYDERPLSLVQEEEEYISRSGTPTNANVQQSYFTHHRDLSSPTQSRGTTLPRYASPGPSEDNMSSRGYQGSAYGYQNSSRGGAASRRTLSVRNGDRRSADSDSGYGGMY